MSSPSKIRRDTRVFISAVTKELGTVRNLVEVGLKANDYHAVEQTDFALSYRDIVDKLRERIAGCDAVVHIAGRCYGAEPYERPEGVDRRSYTQLEYDIAKELDKPVYVFVTGQGFPADPHEPELDDLSQLQSDHCQHLTRSGQDYSRPTTREQLDQQVRSLQLKVERLEKELTQVDENVTAIANELSQQISYGLQVLQQVIVETAKTQADIIQTELAKWKPDDIKDLLLKATEDAYQKDLQEADKLTEWQKRGSAKRSAAVARDQKLGMVDETVARFTRTIMSGNASPEYLELTRILQEQGIDQVVAYITSQVPRLLERADQRAAENQRENRRELAPLLECAKLQFIKGNLVEAIRLSEEVQKRVPEWSENNQNYFWSMIRMVQMELYGGDGKRAISRIEAIETRAQRVQDSFPEDLPSREALALAAGLRGDIHIQAGEFEQAEQRFKECHEALIPLSAEAPDNKSIQRSLAVLSDKLGRVLLNKNDDENAGLLFTQGRDLLTALLQKYPGDTDCLYSLAVSYESLGTLAMKKADYRLAERCFEEQQTILIAFPEQNPLSVFARLSLVASHLNLALVKASLGEAQEARSMLNSALRVLDALATESPDFQRVQETTFAAKYTTGRVLRKTSDFQGSIDAYQSAHQYLREHPDLPRNCELLRQCEASSLILESILLSTKGDILGARDKAVAGLTAVEEIMQTNKSAEWLGEQRLLKYLILTYDFGLGNDAVLPGLFK